MVLTVSKLYKVAKALEKNPEVLKLHEDWKNSGAGDFDITSVVVSVINNAGISESNDGTTLFENDSLEITTYNGRLYYAVYNESGKKRNANLTDDILKMHELTARGESFIKNYLYGDSTKSSNDTKKSYKGGKKKFNKNNKKPVANKTKDK